MSERSAKRGRPRLTRDTVQDRLREFGWEIPENIKYRGANEVHTVRCTCCGYLTEKILHNVVYRKETCPNKMLHAKLMGSTPLTTVSVAGNTGVVSTEEINKLINKSMTSAVNAIKEMVAEQQELILTTAINREDLIEKFNKLYAGTVSRKGYLKYSRQMNAVEWSENSDIIARDLIDRLDPAGDTKLAFNYSYHTRKNPQLKPEKVLLMIMNKKQLFMSLEKLHLIKMLL